MTNSDKNFSFEFFPPRTDAGKEKLVSVWEELNTLNPDYFSVTYGAGGSTRKNTLGIVTAMRKAGLDVAPHLSFGGDDDTEILALIKQYKDLGVNRIVALRGDTPSGMGAGRSLYANELVEFIRANTGDHFNLAVAAYPEIHPESKSYDSDITFLKQKLDAGANSAITQYFYSADAYFCYIDECARAGIDQPIYAGIMPITNFENLTRFSANCGAEIPRWLSKKLATYGDDKESVIAFGIDYVSHLSESLLAGGAPGIHFYTMNQVDPTRIIWNNLGLSDR
jgi:methylenetetrahydrofolate reductase (NADPH)|tara:strand:+ start:12408 stop:13250 length:843 start_codon:yes stop_codon:yes gene_type:complete